MSRHYAGRVSVASINAIYDESPSPKPVSASTVRSELRQNKLKDIGRRLGTIECHGLSSLVSSSRLFPRLLWAGILVTALGITIAFLVESTRHYLSKPIVTAYDLISDSDRALPDIYICPCNAINSTFMQRWNIDPNWASFFVAGDSGNSDRVVADVRINRTTAPQFANLSLTEYFMVIGYQIPAFFQECKFRGREFDCSTAVTEIFDESRGKCFLLRLPSEEPEWRQRRAKEGLELLLDLHTNLYPPLDSAVPTPSADGASFTIASEHTPGAGESLLVSPGTLTEISLDAKFIQRVNGVSLGRRQTCVPPGWIDLNVLGLPVYTQDACMKDCRMKAVMEACGCARTFRLES